MMSMTLSSLTPTSISLPDLESYRMIHSPRILNVIRNPPQHSMLLIAPLAPFSPYLRPEKLPPLCYRPTRMIKRRRTVQIALLSVPFCSAFHYGSLHGSSNLSWQTAAITSSTSISRSSRSRHSRRHGSNSAFSSAALWATADSSSSSSSAKDTAASAAADTTGSTTVNGASPSSSSSSLVTQADSRSQLFSAFTNLDLSDQYDAVLTGLCAKILDAGKALAADQATVKLQDCQQLLQEMNESRIAASPRSLMAMVDSTVKTEDAKTMASVMSQCLRNPKGVTQYGAQQADLRMLPSSPTAKVRCPDGKLKTVRERLDSVAAIPVDDRASEVAAALLFAATVVSCEATNLLPGLEDVQPVANFILAAVLGVVAIDNFYDILKNGSQFVVNQIGKDPAAGKSNNDFQLPDKDSLPAGLGSGQATGRVVRGLARLLAVDAEREAANEAAALYAAYVLGLPCYAYRPNALEGSVLVVESATAAEEEENNNNNNSSNRLDSLLTDSGILRMLVWLMAPVAMESATHAQLIMSDPREATGFLTRLEEYFGADDERLFWRDGDDDDDDEATSSKKDNLLQWAYTEADCLLRDNKAAVQEIANRLSGGAATVGDCVAVIENW